MFRGEPFDPNEPPSSLTSSSQAGPTPPVSVLSATSSDDVVVFQSEIDVLILRFANKLVAASYQGIVFSTRKYGFLIGQLPSTVTVVNNNSSSLPPPPSTQQPAPSRVKPEPLLNALDFTVAGTADLGSDSESGGSLERALVIDDELESDDDELIDASVASVIPRNVATDESNVEDRVFMCLEKGSYAVERALSEFATHADRQMQRVRLMDVIRSERLLDRFIELAVSIQVELTLHAGMKHSQASLVEQNAQRRRALLDEIVITVYSEASNRYIPGQGSLDSVSRALPAGTEQMTTVEQEYYRTLQHRRLHPLHRMLKLCMDATFVQESSFVRGKYVWTVPVDIEADALALHLGPSPLLHSLDCSLTYVQDISQMVKRPFANKSVTLRWILQSRAHITLFVNLVACIHFTNQINLRKSNLILELRNRMTIDLNTRCCEFARAINPTINISPLVEVVTKRSKVKRRR